jgi:hypothetical protein
MRPKSHPESQKENALFREMGAAFVPPAWATTVIVVGDAAYGSQDTIKLVQQRDADEATRRWGFGFALARRWKTVEEQAIKNVVTHVPHKYSQRPRVPRLPAAKRDKTFWT